MEINSEEWHKKTGECLASITARMERDNLRAMGVPGGGPKKTLTLEDVKTAMRKLREIPPMTPEQEARVREQLKGKKPGDYVECDLFIGIMPDFDKLDEQGARQQKHLEKIIELESSRTPEEKERIRQRCQEANERFGYE
jgi:hypothetical protein